MNLIFPKFRDCFLTCLLAASLLAPAAQAGSISFGLSLTDKQLTLTNHGNSSAFYTTVLRLLGDGRWEELPPAPGSQHAAEMRPNAQRAFTWPTGLPTASQSALEALRPVMVRFFDQAGASFGQISFFNQPPDASDQFKFSSRYANGRMLITPANNNPLSASWLLWPQEEGIAPLTAAVQFTHQQPNARRIAWQPGIEQTRFDLGRGLPLAFLLHETEQGFASQVLSDGRVQGRQQRTDWLKAGQRFEFLARLAAAAGAALFAWHLAGAWRIRSGK